MALGPLTLDVTYGVAGRRFQASVSGQSAGSTIEAVVGGADAGTPGFGYSNGRVIHPALPSTSRVTLVLRETLAGTGTRDSRIDIAVDGIALGAAGLSPALAASGISALQQKLKRAASRAAASNPETSALSAFSFTQTQTEDTATYPNVYTNTTPITDYVQTKGGVPINPTATAQTSFVVPSASKSGGSPGNFNNLFTAGDVRNNWDGSNHSFVFDVDCATALQFRFNGALANRYFRVLVDDKYANSKTPTAFATVDPAYITLTLDGGPHRCEFETSLATSLLRIRVPGTATIRKPTQAVDRVTALYSGDSYSPGYGSQYAQMGSWAWTCARLTGVDDPRIVALPGTGYLQQDNTTSAPPILSQIPYWPIVHSDLADANGKMPGVHKVYFAAGYNDSSNFTPAQIQAQAVMCWQAARAMCPNALIIVVANWSGVLGPTNSNILNTEDALLAAFRLWGDGNSLFIPVNRAKPAWITGTGKVGAVTGDGNADFFMANENPRTHPSFAGHGWVASRVAAAEFAFYSTL